MMFFTGVIDRYGIELKVANIKICNRNMHTCPRLCVQIKNLKYSLKYLPYLLFSIKKKNIDTDVETTRCLSPI